MKIRTAIVPLYLMLIHSIICAAVPDSTAQKNDSVQVQNLDHLVVKAQRSRILASEIIDSVKVSRPQESRTVDGLLTDLPGVDVKRSSPAAGKGRGVTIRGFDESRFQILLDGRPLNGCGVMGGDYVDWASLSNDNIEKVEVIRGSRSAEFGNSFGGVVNIITKGNKKPQKTKVTASYGIVSPEHAEDFHENRKTDFSIVHHQNIGSIASFDLYASRGSGEPFLRNNYYNMTNFGGNLSLYFPKGIEFGAGLRSSLQKRGFAIENHPDSIDYNPDYPVSEASAGGGPGIQWKGGDYYYGNRSYWNNLRTQTDFSLAKKFKRLHLAGRLFVNNQSRTEYFYAITDTNTLVLERFAKPEDYTWGWNIKATQQLGEKHTLKYGVEGLTLQYSNTDIHQIDTSYFRYAPSDGDEERIRASNQYSLYIQSELIFFDRIELTPGLRYDYYIGTKRDETMKETPLHGVSPNGGLTVQTWKGGAVSVHGAYRYRFPTCPELYWYYNGHSFDGRKDLLPERAAQFEGGIAQHLEAEDLFSMDLDVRGYRYHVLDYLRTVFGGRPVPPLKPKSSRLIYNIDKVTFTGIEAEVKSTVVSHLNIRVNYTYQITHKIGDIYDKSMTYSDGLPELPEHKANAGIDYRWDNGASAGLSMRFVGEREVLQESFSSTGAAYRKVDSFVTFRIFGIYPFYTSDIISSKLKVGIDNLFNAEYEEDPGIPMPGITGTAAIEFTF